VHGFAHYALPLAACKSFSPPNLILLPPPLLQGDCIDEIWDKWSNHCTLPKRRKLPWVNSSIRRAPVHHSIVANASKHSRTTSYKFCNLRMGKDFQRMIVRQWVVQFKIFNQCKSLVCHVHPPARAVVHSPQHVWYCGNGCLGVRNVRMEMQSIKWDSSDATPENCVGFFRVLDHSGIYDVYTQS